MAGHSQFKNIMYRKGAQDAKRGKLFTKLIRELTTAARAGWLVPGRRQGASSRADAFGAIRVPRAWGAGQKSS